MAKRLMTIPMYDWDTTKLQDQPTDVKCEMSFSNQVAANDNFGMPITVNAFHKMLQQFIEMHDGDDIFDINYVEFSKASLFRILCQETCEYIRFYFAFPAPGKLSLVLEGLDSDRKPVKFDKVLAVVPKTEVRMTDPGDPNYEERGNGEDGFNQPDSSVLAALRRLSASSGFDFIKEGTLDKQNPDLLTSLLKEMNNK